MTAPRLRTPERGAALLTVLVAVAVLTALAADVAYESRVSLRIAANARDELRAEYQARSGVALSRLVLSFQQQLDGTGTVVPNSPTPRVQLWRAVPVTSDLVAGLFGTAGGSLFSGSLFDQPAQGARPTPASAPASPAPAPPTGASGAKAAAVAAKPGAPAAPQASAKPPESRPPASGGGATFDAVIEDEATKVNAQLDMLVAGSSASQAAAQLLSLYQLMCDTRWDPLFDREDASGYKGTRGDLLSRLRDWVDLGTQSAALRANFGSTSCAMTPLEPPFEAAYGDKNQPYDRGDDRYRTKNAHMDSRDELYLVAGVTDAFMAAFGDQLTVYLPPNAKLNVNDLSRDGLLLRARMMVDPRQRPALDDPNFYPAFLDRLQKVLFEQTFGGILSLTPMALGLAMTQVGSGLSVNNALLAPGNTSSPFTDRSDTFRIRSTGTAGDVKTTIEAIVRLEQQQGVAQIQAQAQGIGAPGRVIHWRED